MVETTGNRKMQIHTTGKPFNITKKQVYEAYKACLLTTEMAIDIARAIRALSQCGPGDRWLRIAQNQMKIKQIENAPTKFADDTMHSTTPHLNFYLEASRSLNEKVVGSAPLCWDFQIV